MIFFLNHVFTSSIKPTTFCSRFSSKKWKLFLVFSETSVCFSYKQFRQCRFSSLASFRLPTFKMRASQRNLHSRATISTSERLPVRDRILGLERAPTGQRSSYKRDYVRKTVPLLMPAPKSSIQMKKSRREIPLSFLSKGDSSRDGNCPWIGNRFSFLHVYAGSRGLASWSWISSSLHLLLLLLPTPPLFLPLSYYGGWCALYRRWDACTPCRRWLWTHP